MTDPTEGGEEFLRDQLAALHAQAKAMAAQTAALLRMFGPAGTPEPPKSDGLNYMGKED